MKITWIPSEELKTKAIRVSTLKENLTYDQLAGAIGLDRTYVVALKKLGDQLRKEQHEE